MHALQETYNYYYLPFCKHKPNEPEEHDWGGLGEVLQGNELINSQLDIKFKGMWTLMGTQHSCCLRGSAACVPSSCQLGCCLNTLVAS